jgi:hypothetical protein
MGKWTWRALRRYWLLDDWTRVLYSNKRSLCDVRLLRIGVPPRENRSRCSVRDQLRHNINEILLLVD